MTEITPRKPPRTEVSQKFKSTSIEYPTPSLPGCVVGPCFEIIEAVDDAGNLNPDALSSTRATVVLSRADNYAIGAKAMVIRVNSNPEVTVLFTGADGASISKAQVVTDIRNANITGLEVVLFNDDIILRTVSVGSGSKLTIGQGTDPIVLTAFGLGAGQSTTGSSGYLNTQSLTIGQLELPSPRNNIRSVDVDEDSLRVFINTNAGDIREASPTSTILGGAESAVTVVDDGDSDGSSPRISVASATFTAASTQATCTGNVVLTGIDYAADVTGRSIVLGLNHGAPQTVTLTGVTDAASLVAAISAAIPGLVASVSGGNFLILTATGAFGADSAITVVSTDPAVKAVTDSIGLTTAGGPFETVSTISGGMHPPQPGDVFWADGRRLGQIVSVVDDTNLVLDTELLLPSTFSSWQVQATDLVGVGDALRPTPDVWVDPTGILHLKAGIFRNPDGSFAQSPLLSLYIAYKGLRHDVTSGGAGFELVRCSGVSEIERLIGPITPDNPLAYGMYCMAINSPGLEVLGLGIDEINGSSPMGTDDSYARAFEYLGSKEDVYSLVPLSNSLIVGHLGKIHVTEMSEPDVGSERILLFCPEKPDRVRPTVVASGQTGNVVESNLSQVDTGVADLQSRISLAGLSGTTFTEEDQFYLVFEGSSNRYLISGVAGSMVQLSTATPSSTLYYNPGGSDVFDGAIVDRPFSLEILGREFANLTEEAMAYGQVCASYDSRRVYAITPDKAITSVDGLVQAVNSCYLACSLAGIVASKLPQAVVTGRSATGFIGVVGAKDRFGRNLDLISGGGGLIFTTEGSTAEVREHLSTSQGEEDTKHLPITTQLDFVAKFLRSALRGIVGKVNITDNALDSLSVALSGAAMAAVGAGWIRSLSIGDIRPVEGSKYRLQVEINSDPKRPLNGFSITLVV